MTWQIEKARKAVADQRERCRKSWGIEGVHPEHIFFAAHNYHRECQELMAAEERLRVLELERKGAA